jgi:hypothetical protein
MRKAANAGGHQCRRPPTREGRGRGCLHRVVGCQFNLWISSLLVLMWPLMIRLSREMCQHARVIHIAGSERRRMSREAEIHSSSS